MEAISYVGFEISEFLRFSQRADILSSN